jgi:hypothetical protein
VPRCACESEPGGVGSSRRDVTNRGHQIFVDELARFAAGVADARVTTIAETVAAPLRVEVCGRRGVGCSTVARAVDRAGIPFGICAAEVQSEFHPDADIVVYVIAEVVKPEDSEAVGAISAGHPVLVVLNKADLAGFAGDGPIVAALARCAEFAELLGVPVEPMIGLLAALDDWDDAWAAVGELVGFLAVDGPVPAEGRRRLLNSLDLFGTSLAVAAVNKDYSAAQLQALLRQVSCVDAVVATINALGAELRYRRVLDAVAALEALAVCESGSGDRLGERIGEFLTHDDTVLSRMAEAADLVDVAGSAARPPAGPAGIADGPAAHLSRAVRWQRYSVDCSASDVHRACAADIARGSLRLWSRACALGASR